MPLPVGSALISVDLFGSASEVAQRPEMIRKQFLCGRVRSVRSLGKGEVMGSLRLDHDFHARSE